MGTTAQHLNSVWHPSAIAKANVTRLAAELRCKCYAELYALSIEEPSRYWAHLMEFLQIRWSRPYNDYCDLSLGKPFPKWFVGGELNWVDTIFGWAERNGDRVAIIAEREDGTISRLNRPGFAGGCFV